MYYVGQPIAPHFTYPRRMEACAEPVCPEESNPTNLLQALVGVAKAY